MSTTTSKTTPTTRKRVSTAAPATPVTPLSTKVDDKVRSRGAALRTKAPTELHCDMAAWITMVSGVQITPKQAQVLANLRMDYQRSESNKIRDEYKGLQVEEVTARSEHMIQANLDAKAAIAKRLQAEAEKQAAADAKRKPRAPRKARAKKVVVEAPVAPVEAPVETALVTV